MDPEYAVVCKTDLIALSAEITRRMNDPAQPWTPQGGMAAIARNDKDGNLQTWFLQAVTRGGNTCPLSSRA